MTTYNNANSLTKKTMEPTEILVIISFAGFIIYLLGNNLAEYLEVPNFLGYTIVSLVAYAIWHLMKSDKIINNKLFSSQPWEMGSYANFHNQTAGQRWTRRLELKTKTKKTAKQNLYLDEFRYSNQVKWHFSFLLRYIPFLNKLVKPFDCYIDPFNLTKSSLIIGKMGGGKSEFFFTMLKNATKQKLINRSVIYDTSGDFIKKFYSRRRDIIANVYDERARVWDIFEEMKTNEKIFSIFFESYFNAKSGDKKDFFSASAAERYKDIAEEIHHKKPNSTSKEKWQMFIESLDAYFERALSGEQESERDVASTMKLSVDIIKFQNYLIQNGAKTFTFQEFLHNQNKKLFLSYTTSYKTELQPYYAGLLASMFAVMLSLPATEKRKKDLTFLALDEYLTFAQSVSNDMLIEIHTKIRKYGGLMMPAIQNIPESNKKLVDNVLPNVEYFFIFGGTDNNTLERIEKTVGKAEYRGVSNNNQNLSTQTQEGSVFNREMFHTLSDKFEHITINMSNKLMYLGYTKNINILDKAEYFIPISIYSDFKRNV